MIQAVTANRTQIFEDGQEVFPCRCGVTHKGDYAFEDWNHHNCFHHGPLWVEEGEDEAMCSQCGEVFDLKIRRTA